MEEPIIVKKSYKFKIGLIILVVIVIGIIVLIFIRDQKENIILDENKGITQQEKTNNNSIVNPSDVSSDTSTKTFNVEASNFAFSLKEIKVKEGEKVVINFVNKEGFHDFVLDEFNAKTSQLEAGKTEKLEFTAEKKGTFEFYCSVGNHRQMGMKGNFIVE